MNTALVGYTGFVGSNLTRSRTFDYQYNSCNIKDSFGLNPDLLIYSGVRAEKFLANQNPEADKDHIEEAFANIQRIRPKRLVLISTIDVYKIPNSIDEYNKITTENLQPYGAHRYWLEQAVRETYPHTLVVRLPGLFGINLKKNFIYDLINVIPSMLSESKFNELNSKESILSSYYFKNSYGFYERRQVTSSEKSLLKELFYSINFTALNFTDSRAVFQFYHLKYLWNHIETALVNSVPLVNLATEPVKASEIYSYVTGGDFYNEMSAIPPSYDFRTRYDKLFGGAHGYLYNKEQILEEIKVFIQEQTI